MLTNIRDESKALREHRLDIEEFNYAYAETLDAMDVDEPRVDNLNSRPNRIAPSLT